MNTALRKKIYTGFVIASLLIAIISYFYNRSTEDFIDSSIAVQVSNRKLVQLETVLSILKDAETGQRGFIITKKEVFLEPYHNARARLTQEIQRLSQQMDDPYYQPHLQALQGLIDTEVAFLDSNVRLVKQGQQQQAVAIVTSGQGKSNLDQIRAEIGAMQQKEADNLKALEIEADKNADHNYIANYVGIAVTVILFGIGIVVINADLYSREKLERELLTKNESLLTLNEELSATNEELQASNEKIREYSQLLEDRNRMLEYLNDELADLYNNAPVAYHSLDKELRFLRVNDTELRWTGYNRNEVIGFPVTQFLTESSIEKLKVTHSAFTGKSHIEDVEYEVIRKDGSIMPVLLSSRAAYDENGQLSFTKSTFTDHTALKKAQLEIAVRNVKLEQANKELEAFSYSISHDLQSPLHTIAGFASLLSQKYAQLLDTEGMRMIEVIEQNAFRMDALITDLLRFSRLGRAALKKTRISMRHLVDSVIQELTSSETAEQYTFTVQELPDAFVDRQLMKQVWVNLISNAMKFSAHTTEPHIIISCKDIPGYTEYSIRDNGVGFDMAQAANLFGVFKRLPTGREFAGNGIGLAIVERIVTYHGGEVRAEAQLNKGATFYLTIPK